jgi:hypothetical protein
MAARRLKMNELCSIFIWFLTTSPSVRVLGVFASRASAVYNIGELLAFEGAELCKL